MDLVKGSFSWTCSSIGGCRGPHARGVRVAHEFARTEKRSGPHPVIG
jgi:hypothetical protein